MSEDAPFQFAQADSRFVFINTDYFIRGTCMQNISTAEPHGARLIWNPCLCRQCRRSNQLIRLTLIYYINDIIQAGLTASSVT